MDFIKKIKNKPKTGFSVGSITFEADENHHTMPISSFYKGLRYIFDGYMIDNEARFRSVNELKNHFEEVSDKLGADFHLKEDLIDYFGYDRSNNVQFVINVNRAIESFKSNARIYPLFSIACSGLGKSYLVNGEKKKALVAYQKSLSLNVNNSKLKDKIKQLQMAE